MKIIFLDIDGVLNRHDYSTVSESTNILSECVGQLNRILADTGAFLVLSSAWRYCILQGSMTIQGFASLLRSHGVMANRLLDYTEADSDDEGRDRYKQIQNWLDHRFEAITYVVLDDQPGDMVASPDVTRLVKTDGNVGLTKELADRAIALLNGGSNGK